MDVCRLHVHVSFKNEYLSDCMYCMFAIHLVSFKPGSAKLARMVEYHQVVNPGQPNLVGWYNITRWSMIGIGFQVMSSQVKIVYLRKKLQRPYKKNDLTSIHEIKRSIDLQLWTAVAGIKPNF